MTTAREVDTMAADRRRASHQPSTPAAQRVGRVLLVEDEQDVAELIRYNLAKEGYEVVVTANGADALRLARERQPDVVLLDIMVPQLNGWEVCRRLKKDPELSAIPVIMVTGRVEEGDKVLGFEVGADDYVTKPFSPRELLARIRAVLRRRGLADAKEKKRRLKAGTVLADNNTSLQVENQHGKRTKVKEAAVLIRFDHIPLTQFTWHNFDALLFFGILYP